MSLLNKFDAATNREKSKAFNAPQPPWQQSSSTSAWVSDTAR